MSYITFMLVVSPSFGCCKMADGRRYITPREHYEDLTRLGEGLGKSVADLDSKLSSKIDAVLVAVMENRERVTTQYAGVQVGLQVLQDLRDKPGGLMDRLATIDKVGGRLDILDNKIVDLRVSDKQVGVIASIIGAVAAAISGVIASRQ